MPLSSTLRAPFQRAHDVVLQSFDAIDPHRTNIEMLIVAWGTHRNRKGQILPANGTPTSPVLNLRLSPFTRPSHHHHLHVLAQQRTFEGLWQEVHAPLIKAIVEAMPILQGPESMGSLVWFQRHPEQEHRPPSNFCVSLLELNHQAMHESAGNIPTSVEDLLRCLDRVATATAPCTPATHHFAIASQNTPTSPYATSAVSAANTADARIFLTAINPEHWAPHAHTVAFTTKP